MLEIKINGEYMSYDKAKELYKELYDIFGIQEYTPFIPYKRWLEPQKPDWTWRPTPPYYYGDGSITISNGITEGERY